MRSPSKLVIHDSSRAWCGNERQALLLARALRAEGHEVVFACHPRGLLLRRLREEGIPAAGVGPRGPLDLWSLLRFAAWLRRQRPDALLLTAPQRAARAARAARWAGVPRVLLRVGTLRDLRGEPALRRALRRRIHGVVANSDDARAHLLRREPWLEPERVRVLANRVETDPVPPEAAAAVRRELGIGAGVPLVATVAVGMRPRKGVDLLLRALARLRRRDARLLVAGQGPQEAALRALAARLGVAERVHWLGFRDDVPAVLAASDVFCSASRRDSLANAMLEAMAAGALVVATDTGGVREALGAAGSGAAAGWVVPVDDEAALAAALDEALAAAAGDLSEARARRAEARARVLRRYAVEGGWPGAAEIVFGAARPG